jgi:uncharacterized protein YndB with AHSA1/START domain
MSEARLTSDTSLSLSRTFDAPREVVFEAWTDPTVLKEWWGPGGFTTPSVEMDLREGGKYRIAMQPPVGDLVYVGGTFREIRPPARLVYTWAWEEDDGPGHESLVTLDFADRNGKTVLTLTHERLADAESRDGHVDGWSSSLDRLGPVLSRR